MLTTFLIRSFCLMNHCKPIAKLTLSSIFFRVKIMWREDSLSISNLTAIRFIKYIWVFLSFQRYLRFKNGNRHAKFINNILLHVFVSVLQQWAYFHVMINNFSAHYEQEILMLLSIICFSVMLVLLAWFSQLSRIRVNIKEDTSIHNSN